MAFNVSEQFVLAAEEVLGAHLPESYRKSMQMENGGEVKAMSDYWTLVPIQDKSDRKRIARTSYDIVRETRDMADWTGWPETAVKIAQNGTGDALLFMIEGKVCTNEVYHWAHETGETTKIADDFSELKR
ncbi:MAG: SMI1/KNR4 family protein [Pseudomonadota bacterium]